MVVPKASTIAALLTEVGKKLDEEGKLKGTKVLRLVETFNGKVQKKFKETESMDWLHEYGHIILRVEVRSVFLCPPPSSSPPLSSPGPVSQSTGFSCPLAGGARGSDPGEAGA